MFALICGEINVIEGRTEPRYVSAAAESAGTLDAKRKLLARQADDERNRVYVSCYNREVCGDEKTGRTQSVTPTPHTVYAAGEQSEGEQFADGSFGFVYRHWSRDLWDSPRDRVTGSHLEFAEGHRSSLAAVTNRGEQTGEAAVACRLDSC